MSFLKRLGQEIGDVQSLFELTLLIGVEVLGDEHYERLVDLLLLNTQIVLPELSVLLNQKLRLLVSVVNLP